MFFVVNITKLAKVKALLKGYEYSISYLGIANIKSFLIKNVYQGTAQGYGVALCVIEQVNRTRAMLECLQLSSTKNKEHKTVWN